MSTLTPKQLEIQERELKILASARARVVSEGYHGLNMDRIAEEIKASKGTVYNHFSCKEEIIIALAVQTMEKRAELFQAAAQFKSGSRQRILAVGRANGYFFEKFPDHFRFEQMLRIDSIWEKTSEKRRILVKSCEMKCMSVVSGVVRDAIASEDLVLPENTSPEDLVFGLWSISLGAQSIMASSESLTDLGVKNPAWALHFHMQKLLDSFQWMPLSTEFDYEAVEARIDREVLKLS